MFRARVLPTGEEYVTRVTDFELVEVCGMFVKRRREQRATEIKGGGASAVSTSPEGALASARALLRNLEDEQRIRNQRDRA